MYKLSYKICFANSAPIEGAAEVSGGAWRLALDLPEDIIVSAQAQLHDCESDNAVTATAYAREPEKKTGMDESQITGTASSYARKYALNGLFCIDDTKDADTDEYKQQEKKEKPSKAEMESFNQAYKEQFDYTCQDCKQPITPQSFNGKLYRVSDISKGAMKKYGVPLCWSCMEKRKANESPTA